MFGAGAALVQSIGRDRFIRKPILAAREQKERKKRPRMDANNNREWTRRDAKKDRATADERRFTLME
jgi:hypothetical protein